MSNIVPQFDPSATPTGSSFAAHLPNGGWLLLTNESQIALQLFFPQQGRKYILAPFSIRMIRVRAQLSNVEWTQAYQLVGANSPVSLVTGEIMESSEYQGDEFIKPLPRLMNVGNQVSTTGATALQQDGSGPGTLFLESTPSDQAVSSFKFFNDASGNMSVLSAGTVRDILRITRGNAGVTKAVIVIGDAGDLTITTLHGTADQVPAAGVQAGTLAAGVHETQITSDGGAFDTDGTGKLTWARTLSAGNQLADLQQGYGLYSDNAAGTFSGGTTRIWLDCPATGGEMHFGGRAGSSILAGIRFRCNQIRMDTSGQSGGSSNLTRGWNSSNAGNGSGTYTHSVGFTPTALLANTFNGSNSTTFGSGTYGTTTAFIFEFNAQAFVWFVWVN